MILADAGTVSYNGYQFDGASQVTIRCEPVYDDAQRTVVYHRYRINVKSVVANAAGTGLDLALIRALLTKAGQALIVHNKGFYDLYANASSPDGYINDVAFGPKPRIVSWTPIGAAYACEVEWECEACIAYCGLPKYYDGILAFNYDLSYSLDHRGLTVRTIAGYYEIAMTRLLYAVPNTADAYRSVVSPAIPSRFQRTSQSYKLSLDKRRMDFSIVDTELPSNNPYPNGVVKIDARHRVGWSRRGGQAATLRNTITVDIEMAPDQPMLNAYAAFAEIVKKRIDIAKAAYSNGVIIDELSAEENLFDRTCSFSVGYRILSSLQQLLADTGLWTPLGLTTWGAWAYSLENITDQRGYANLRHLAANDAIVDPCGSVFTIPWDAAATEKAQEAPKPKTLLKNETPAPSNSWLDFKSQVYVYRDRAVVRQAILQPPETEDSTYDPYDTGGTFYTAAGGGGQNDIIQRSGQSRYTAILTGRARRAGHKVPRPSLTTIGSATTKERDNHFVQDIDGNWLGVPVYRAEWYIVYDLDKAPDAVLPQADVQEGVQSDGATDQPTGP
jgi:hypothetical protein